MNTALIVQREEATNEVILTGCIKEEGDVLASYDTYE